MITPRESYPDSSEMSSAEGGIGMLPNNSLKVFLNRILTGKQVDVKMASLGQALMQAARPRVLTLPLQIGLGVQLHHHFASRFLIETLYRMGFCSSYDELKSMNVVLQLPMAWISLDLHQVILCSMQQIMLTTTS